MYRCPYKGLMPYTEEDARYFFGRDTERRIIADNLRASRLTVFYGTSGVGKSSVLRAGVAHDLKDDPDYAVVVFRDWRDDPLLGLNAAIRQRLVNIPEFADNALQHEDADLCRKLEKYLASVDRTLLVILDQFEEYFQYQPSEDGEHGFAEQFPRLLNAKDLPVHFLISIREDSLASLDRFKRQMPSLLDNRLGIDFLSREAAKDAILKPLERFNEDLPTEPIKMDDNLAANIVQEIIEAQGGEKDRVQTAYLQLVLTRWLEREMELGSREMRAQTLADDLGGVKRLVDEHLETTIKTLGPDEQQAAAFEYMVTPSGRKIAQTVSDLASSTKLEKSNLERVLEKLRQPRVLTPVPPPRGSTLDEKCYEFAHDVVAKAALDWRKQFQQAQELAAKEARLKAEEAQKFLEERARQATKLRRLVWVLGGLLLIALAASIFALSQRRNALSSQRMATARELVSSSILSLQQDPERSLLLAMHAVKLTWLSEHAVLPEAEDQLHRAVVSSHVRLTLSGHARDVLSVA